MNTASRSLRTIVGSGDWRGVAAVAAAGALITWTLAVLLVVAMAPTLAPVPAFADLGHAIMASIGPLAFTASVGEVLVLLGLATTLRAPRRATGRVVMLVGGLLLIVMGVFLLETALLEMPLAFESTSAVLLASAAAAMMVLVGVVDCMISESRSLPGQPLVDRMMLPEQSVRPPLPVALLLAASAALAAVWTVAMTRVLASHLENPFLVMQFAMPVLAGTVAAAWRADKRNRLQTLATCSAAGLTSSLLFWLIMTAAHYYSRPAVEFLPWWCLTGAILGALGCWFSWLLLPRRQGVRRAASPSTLRTWTLWKKLAAIGVLLAVDLVWLLLTGANNSFLVAMTMGLAICAVGGYWVGPPRWWTIPLVAMAVEVLIAVPATLVSPDGGESPISVVLEAPFWTGAPALFASIVGAAVRALFVSRAHAQENRRLR